MESLSLNHYTGNGWQNTLVKKELPDQLKFLENRKAPLHQTQDSVQGKRILLSGATSGIGLASAHRLSKDGAELILLIRNLEKGMALKAELESLYHNSVHVFVADYEDLSLVSKAAEKIKQHFDSIDVLVHNAGIHSTKRKLSKQGHELSFAVNYLASFLLTRKLLPLLEKGTDPHIIYVNSEGHRFGKVHLEDLNFNKRHYTGLKGYGQSKTAQLLNMLHCASGLKKKGIRINAMHPGDVKSNIGQNNGLLYKTFSKFFIQPILQDVHRASDAMHYLLADKSLLNTSAHFFHLTTLEKPADYALDETLAKALVDKSLELIEAYL